MHPPVRAGVTRSSVVVIAGVGLYAECVATHLAGCDGIAVAGATTDPGDALRLVRERRPDVVLLGIDVRDGLALLRLIAGERDPARVVVLGLDESDHRVIQCAESGAAGFVALDAPLAALAPLIRRVAVGEAACSPRIAARLLERVAALASTCDPQPADVALTPREREIVALIDEGLSNKEIARRLCIELATVKNHVHNVLRKLEVNRRAEAAALLRRAGRDRVVDLGAHRN
jgi:two-component system, NarL family, nitrate/nitrite response regulator NarL